MFTTAPAGELRSTIVVDSDEDDATAVPTGEVVFSDDLTLETFAGRRHDANVVVVNRWGTWIAAAAPIRAEDGAVVGAVTTCRQPGHGLPAGVLKSAVSDTFAEIMRTAAARQTRAEIESMTDALTGLYNHRRFHELLMETLSGERADEAEVALLFCDIDHFKQLNDRHGHLVGDDVLRRVSRILTSSIRRGDVAARYGGDEFCVLLRGAGIDEAMEVAERVRERVDQLYVVAGDAGVSISIGVATLSERRDGQELLASADRAMYAAKDGGRDRVVRADTLQEARPRWRRSCRRRRRGARSAALLAPRCIEDVVGGRRLICGRRAPTPCPPALPIVSTACRAPLDERPMSTPARRDDAGSEARTTAPVGLDAGRPGCDSSSHIRAARRAKRSPRLSTTWTSLSRSSRRTTGSTTLDLLLQDESPDVALVDWDLPGVEGPEMCRLVRDFHQGRRTYMVVLASPQRSDTSRRLAGRRERLSHHPGPGARRSRVCAEGAGRKPARRRRETARSVARTRAALPCWTP